MALISDNEIVAHISIEFMKISPLGLKNNARYPEILICHQEILKSPVFSLNFAGCGVHGKRGRFCSIETIVIIEYKLL